MVNPFDLQDEKEGNPFALVNRFASEDRKTIDERAAMRAEWSQSIMMDVGELTDHLKKGRTTSPEIEFMLKIRDRGFDAQFGEFQPSWVRNQAGSRVCP